MRRILVSIIYISSFCMSMAQTLEDYRIWFASGTGAGSIGGVDLNGDNFYVDYTYPPAFFPEGYRPSSLILGGDGKLYGTLDSGHIFRMNQDGTSFELVHIILGSVDGNGLLQGTDGNLYGVKTSGQIYKAVPAVVFAETIYQFSTSDNGVFPVGSLVEDASGVLYGICRQGGVGSTAVPGSPFPIIGQGGTLFKINKDGTGFTKLFDFSFSDGYSPLSLIMGSDGSLYGNTNFGGTTNRGVLYKIETDGTGYTKLLDFGVDNLDYPRGPILEYNSKIYGTTQSNRIYAIDMDGNNLTTVRSFANEIPGEATKPTDIRIWDNKIYGFATAGGTGGSGTIFRLDPDGNNYEDIFHFDGLNGNPSRNVSFDRGRSLFRSTAGDIVAAVSGGGASSNGILFKLSSTLEVTVLKQYPMDGKNPTLIFPFNDNMEGLNTNFGALGYGGAFSIDPQGLNYTEKAGMQTGNILAAISDNTDIFVLASGFDGRSIVRYSRSDDEFTLLQLIENANGDIMNLLAQDNNNLFGASTFELYKVSKLGEDFNFLKAFDQNTEIFSPIALTVNDGIVYGVGNIGGENGYGGIFKIDVEGTNYEEIFHFTSDFTFFSGSLFVGSNGKLYGSLDFAGVNFSGVIFSVNLDGSEFNILTEFTEENFGTSPLKILEAPEHWIVGATAFGGENEAGIIFKVKFDGSELEKIADGESHFTDLVLKEKLPHTINFAELESRVLSTAVTPLVATSSESLAILFETSDSDLISIGDDSFSMLKPGRVTIKASSSSPHFKSGAMSQSFCIFPPKPTITITGEGTPTPVLTSSNPDGNQWYRDGNPIEGATSSTLSITEQGTFTVKTTADDCPSELSDGQIVLITGLYSEAFSLRVYPNPVENQLMVETSGGTKINAVQITDLSGRVLHVDNEINDSQAVFNTSSLPKGLYLMRIHTGNSSRVIKIFK